MSDERDTVAFGGEQFVVADAIGLMPLMRFAKVAQAGADSSDLEGLAAMYDLLEQCIHEDDWVRFQKVATRVKADDKALFGVVREVMATVAGRPTRRPSDSSDGPPSTKPNSGDVSSSRSLRVVQRLEDDGRPDLALMVQMAEEARSAV